LSVPPRDPSDPPGPSGFLRSARCLDPSGPVASGRGVSVSAIAAAIFRTRLCIDFAHLGSIIKHGAPLSNPAVVIVRSAAGFERVAPMEVVKVQVCGSELKVWTEQACQSKVLFSCFHSTALFLVCLSYLIACLSSLIACILRVRRDEWVEYALEMLWIGLPSSLFCSPPSSSFPFPCCFHVFLPLYFPLPLYMLQTLSLFHLPPLFFFTMY